MRYTVFGFSEKGKAKKPCNLILHNSIKKHCSLSFSFHTCICVWVCAPVCVSQIFCKHLRTVYYPHGVTKTHSRSFNFWNYHFWIKNHGKKWSIIFFYSSILRAPSVLLLSNWHGQTSLFGWLFSTGQQELWRGSWNFKI